MIMESITGLGITMLVIFMIVFMSALAVVAFQFITNASRNMSLASDNATAGLKDSITGSQKSQ